MTSLRQTTHFHALNYSPPTFLRYKILKGYGYLYFLKIIWGRCMAILYKYFIHRRMLMVGTSSKEWQAALKLWFSIQQAMFFSNLICLNKNINNNSFFLFLFFFLFLSNVIYKIFFNVKLFRFLSVKEFRYKKQSECLTIGVINA